MTEPIYGPSILEKTLQPWLQFKQIQRRMALRALERSRPMPEKPVPPPNVLIREGSMIEVPKPDYNFTTANSAEVTAREKVTTLDDVYRLTAKTKELKAKTDAMMRAFNSEAQPCAVCGYRMQMDDKARSITVCRHVFDELKRLTTPAAIPNPADGAWPASIMGLEIRCIPELPALDGN